MLKGVKLLLARLRAWEGDLVGVEGALDVLAVELLGTGPPLFCGRTWWRLKNEWGTNKEGDEAKEFVSNELQPERKNFQGRWATK